ncbi:MAG: hypothetical protein ACU84Q_05540 [Gammaproteobacteria bacterium]
MNKTKSICPIFDGLGLVSLVLAIFALGGSVWFVEAATQGMLLQIFQLAFTASIGCFAVARVIQIAEVVRTTPDPKSLRVVAGSAGTSLENAPADVVAGEIRRAA